MREIKYECWYSGRMLPVGSLQFMSDGTFIVNDELPVLAGNLRQYTGLKDKNGKEIYEGDIVRWSPWEKGTPNAIEANRKNNVVRWSERKACWFIHDDLWTLGIYSDVDVVGNMYEHRHLLPKEQEVERSVATKINQGGDAGKQ